MKEGDPHYAVAESLVKLSPAVIWKTNLYVINLAI